MILKVLTGSRAYGLETPESDYDYHGVFVTPTSQLLAIGPKPKESIWKEGDEDFQSWELGHFLDLAVHCNPTVLETFVAPVEHATPCGFQLRALFASVLTRKRVYDAFLGYSHNQQKKMFNKPDNPAEAQPSPRAWKFAVQYLRILLQGERLLRTGELVLDMRDSGYHFTSGNNYPTIEGPWSTVLMSVRRGKFSMGEVIDMADEFKKRLELAFADSSVREAPDLDAVNEFLIGVRKETW